VLSRVELTACPVMTAQPVTSTCSDLFATRSHVVLGISPFNSHFSEERISALIHWAQSEFGAFHLYIPDEPSRFTLEAVGYSPDRARKKARRQARWLFNKVRRALQSNGFPEPAFDSLVLRSENLAGNEAYRDLLGQAETQLWSKVWFREGCLKTSNWVLSNLVADETDASCPDRLTLAARYFQAELPLFMNSAAITGMPRSVFAYHQCPQFLRQILAEHRGEVINSEQGFLIVPGDVAPDVGKHPGDREIEA